MAKKNLFWFRQDLRLADNPGLYEAAQNSQIMAIYILEEITPQFRKIGAASRWWLHHSLSRLNEDLKGHLNIYEGNSEEIILKLLSIYDFDGVYWNRCYEPWRSKQDVKLKMLIQQKEIPCTTFNASLLWEPIETLKKDKTPYQIFTPFYQKASLKPPRKPLARPEKLLLVKDSNNTISLKDLNLLPSIKWYSSIETFWSIGEKEAGKKLNNFLKKRLQGYESKRNFPAENSISYLSPHLHFGEISPHQIWHSVQDRNIFDSIPSKDVDCFCRELGWREFSYYLLDHFPDLPTKNFQKKFDRFPWKGDLSWLKAWQEGKTGYPFVDAGMRELWQTGYMHNRVRMIVASFLVKNLLLDWRYGEAWFWDCLVDADLASNSVNWQWVAGSGVDPAPYFRIFNPVTQGQKYDPDGTYIRKFVPEISRLPNAYLFRPWEAPEVILKTAGIVLGETYPQPIVDFKLSRQRALSAFSSVKNYFR